MFFNEFALFVRGISTSADNLDAPLFEFLEFITESLAFGDSAGGIGFGEEPQDNLPAPKVLQRDQILIGVRQREIGGGHTRIQ
jgi:hypothetical protein